ncbi:putative metabolite transport protein YwtG [Galleria mellonella]|uniref:Metabolite transport protein YwtG n=1 Tax=Galleria mellonella TaxID=7137 RepID=A0A6J1WBE4_GALME|nr:putative metabolite transport protein YwtG [Galleria mellonella]
MLYKNNDANFIAFRVVLVFRAVILYALEKLRKMVYTVKTTESDQGPCKEVKSGSIWKEFVISFIASIPFFTHGVETTILSTSAHAGHFITSPDDEPWNATAMLIAAGISAPVYCYVIDKFGRKIGIFIISLMQGASLVPLFLPPKDINMLILHIFAGISSGGLFTVLPIYVREISSTNIRGVTISLMMVMTTAGYLMKLVTGVETLMYSMTALLIVQFVLMVVMVESPSYLVMVGKMESATEAISKLRCLSYENPALSNEVIHLRDERDRVRANGKLSLLQILRNRIWWDATKIGFVLYTIHVICGSIVFLDQDKVLLQLKMDMDPEKVLVVASLCGGSLLCLSMVKFIDRKYLLTFGYAIMVLSMGVLGVYTQTELTVRSLHWLPVVALGVLVIGYGLAWGLPIIIMVEMYNFEIRAKLLGLLYTYSQIIKLAHIHSFKYIEEYMGIYTVFYLFACINLFAGVYTLFGIPNIKDKSVKQIERQLKRVPILKL